MAGTSHLVSGSTRAMTEVHARYVDATWDIEEVLAKKDEIVRDNLLVTKLAGPAKAA